jgi:hypothetical protein
VGAPGSLTDLSNQITAALFFRAPGAGAVSVWVRESAEEQPLIILFVATSGNAPVGLQTNRDSVAPLSESRKHSVHLRAPVLTKLGDGRIG